MPRESVLTLLRTCTEEQKCAIIRGIVGQALRERTPTRRGLRQYVPDLSAW